MIRLAFKLILTILGATALGLAISIDRGYILIKYHTFQYQSNLWIALAFIASIFLVIWFLKAILGSVFTLLGKANPFSNDRKLLRGEKGFKELTEGNWSAALKHLGSASKSKQHSLIYFLGAAKAANELGNVEKSDRFIEQAYEINPKAKVAIGVTQIGLLIDRNDYATAQNIAQDLHKAYPNQPSVIRLLYSIYLQQENWADLKSLLPAMQKYKVLSKEAIARLELHAWKILLKQAFANKIEQSSVAIEQLNTAWQEIPSALRKNYQLIEIYVQQLCMFGGYKEAEQFLKDAINKNYQSQLVYLYGQLRGDNLTKQLAAAESWKKHHSSDAILFLTLGRLSIVNQQHEKAREYLEKSLELNYSAETCGELAGLLALLGETEQSNILFQKSLQRLHHSVHKLDAPKPSI